MWLNRLAASLLLLSGCLYSQQPTQTTPQSQTSISGSTLSSTGQPLKDVIVTAFNSDNPSQRFATTSDETGQWQIKDILPGRYFIHAGKNGFSTQAYGGPPGSTFGSSITLSLGQKVTDIQLKLVPGAAIVGRVTDTDGEPVLGVKILIARGIDREGVRHMSFAPFTSTTNDLGEFRFGNLLPGVYFIASHEKNTAMPAGMAVQNPRHEIFAPTFYAGAADPQSAAPITVQAGDEVRANLTIQKIPTFHVTGSILSKEQAWRSAVLRPRSRDLIKIFEERAASVGEKSHFDFEGVPPGEYMIEASGYQGDHRLGAWVPISVVGADVSGVSVALAAYPAIRGTYRCEGSCDKSSVSDHFLRLVPDNEESFGAATGAEVSSGKFEFSGVEPGAYRVFPFDKSSDHRYTNFYLKSITANGQDLLKRGVQVAPGTNLVLEVVESSEGARLSGTITDKEGKPVGGALIDIVPEARDEIHRYVGGLTDREGKFLVQGIPPGDYLIFPWSPESIRPVRTIFQPYRSAVFPKRTTARQNTST